MCKTITQVLDLPRYGGTLVRRDNETVLLVDYDFVSQIAIDAICTQHPTVQVYINKCDSSTSGYMLTFTSVYKSSWLISAHFIDSVLCVFMSLVSIACACGNVLFF